MNRTVRILGLMLRVSVYWVLCLLALLACSNPAARKEPQQGIGEPNSIPKRAPTRASESPYNQDIMKATTSQGLTKADIAWHALNTYGWDCDEVHAREVQVGDYYEVTCTSG